MPGTARPPEIKPFEALLLDHKTPPPVCGDLS
jgi:hypothetical protein